MSLLLTIKRQPDSTGQNWTVQKGRPRMMEAMSIHLTKDGIEAGLAYCRWLHMKQFRKWLDSACPSLPKHTNPVLLNDFGQRIYYQVARELAAQTGTIFIGDGERAAVVKYLCRAKDGHPQPGAIRPATGIKHATLQLNAVTKFMSGGKRTIRGVANSGLVDRVGDVVDPMGGRWTLPVPLLWQHKHDQPIGWVRSIEPKRDGLWITAELAEGIGKADQAWKMIEAGLVDSYSIGFQATEWKPLSGGGKRFTAWSLHEISVVTIPCDPAAKIRRSATAALSAIRGGR